MRQIAMRWVYVSVSVQRPSFFFCWLPTTIAPFSLPFQIIVWEVITLEELYPKFGPFQIANAVLNQQLRPPLGDMSTKFRVVCEVRR